MKNTFILFIIFTAASCQQQLEPNVENINSIFATQDFQIRFTLENGAKYRMGFLNNEMAYFSPQETVRKELSYDDVRLINTFVGDRFRTSTALSVNSSELEHNNEAAAAERSRSHSHSQIEIYNDSKKVVFETPPIENELFRLLDTLKLPYVSTKKK